MHPRLLPVLFLLLAAQVSAPAQNPTRDAQTPPPETPAPPSTLFGLMFGKDNAWDHTYDEWQQWKADHYFPISIGAQHWFHVDRDEKIYGDGYGVPGERGTYYYFLNFDPSYTFKAGDFLKEIGIHFQGRIRDSSEPLRSFYSETYWSYEDYAYARTSWGTFKGGQIVREFGIPWDGTWWEGTPYFDGDKFNPDYGFSWKQDFNFTQRFALTAITQYFIKEDGISGAEPGADPESVNGVTEQNTGVIRLLGTYKINHDTTLALGVSGLYGEIAGAGKYDLDDHRGDWGSDLSLQWKNVTVFGETIRSYGAISPDRYVSGGPSDLRTTFRGGIAYTWGPFTFRGNYSKEQDDHPFGHQSVFDTGITTQLAKNLTLYTEYVKWNVVNQKGVKSVFDDGFELILAWTL